MGRELLSRYSVYRTSLVEAGLYLRSLGCDWDLLSEHPNPVPQKANLTVHFYSRAAEGCCQFISQ